MSRAGVRSWLQEILASAPLKIRSGPVCGENEGEKKEDRRIERDQCGLWGSVGCGGCPHVGDVCAQYLGILREIVGGERKG